MKYNAYKQGLDKKKQKVIIKNTWYYTSNLVTNTTCNTNIWEVGNKIPNVSRLIINTAFNTKIREVGNKIPNVSRLITDTAFNTKIREVENMITKILAD